MKEGELACELWLYDRGPQAHMPVNQNTTIILWISLWRYGIAMYGLYTLEQYKDKLFLMEMQVKMVYVWNNY